MKIIINRLTMTNFKCFRNKEIIFGEHVSTISGRNGAGKTTIGDAILFCLFGKNSAGQSDLELFKTRENGQVIPHLDHAVEIDLSVTSDGHVKNITLRRAIKELWSKKRGTEEMVFKSNTCEYFVNGEAYTKEDFKKYIDAIVSEDVFRAITTPAYFLSLKWQTQREFLERMVGTIEPEVIADTEELKKLVAQLELDNEDVITYRKHLSYSIKQIKEKIERIPIRLEEQNKALPEKLDWDAISEQYDHLLQQQEDVAQKIVGIKSGNGGDVLRNEIRQQQKLTHEAIENIVSEERQKLPARNNEHDIAVNEARQKFNRLVSTQRDLENVIASFDTRISRCRETAEETFKTEQEYIRKEWTKTQADFFKEGQTTCPVCGRVWNEERLEEEKQKFNEHKAELKLSLTKRATDAKKLKADAEEEVKRLQEEKSDKQQSLAAIKEEINTAFSEKQRLEKVVMPPLDDVLKANSDYVSLTNKLSELKDKLDSVVDEIDAQQLTDLEEQKSQNNALLQQLQQQLATRQQYDRGMALIEEINNEQKDLVKQLSELEKKEDVASSFQDRQNAILEERVNQHFSIVKWRMFETINNGGDTYDKPYCECLVNGIPYGGGLNQAARLNAGLDVLNTLCKHYNVSAPVLIDNAESINNILPTIGQQIRLYVSEDDNLTIV